MRSFLLIFFAILVLVGCQKTSQRYRLSDPAKPLEEKAFQLELKKQDIAFEVSSDGWYKTSGSNFERLVSTGKEVNERYGRKSNMPIDDGCSSKKLLEWLQDEKVIFVEIRDEKESRFVSVSTLDFEAKEIMNKYAGFHEACVKVGAEARFNSIWLQSPLKPQ